MNANRIAPDFHALLGACTSGLRGLGMIQFATDGQVAAIYGNLPSALGVAEDLATFTDILGLPLTFGTEMQVALGDDVWRISASTDSGAVLVAVLDETDIYRREANLRVLADQDPLTGLLNRRGLQAQLELIEVMPQAKGHVRFVAVLDVDNLKPVNDGKGHGAGDELICSVAHIVARNLRSHDALARWGGDEFAFVLPDLPLSRAKAICTAIGDAARAETSTTLSIGATYTQGKRGDLGAMLGFADQQLLLAKAAGKATINIAPFV